MLARVYGGGTTLDDAPALDTEWWWCSIDAETDDGRLSIVVDLQIFVLPGLGPQTNCTVAVRNLTTGDVVRVREEGKVSLDKRSLFEGRVCKYVGLVKSDANAATYVIQVDAEKLKLDLTLNLGKVAYFGDPDQPRGWFDNNPKGSFPLWINYRSRFGTVAPSSSLNNRKFKRASARFDQESVHWGLQDISDLSIPATAELLSTMPRWVWVDASVPATDGTTIVVTAFQVYNGNSGTLMKQYIGACDENGVARIVDADSPRFRNFDLTVDADMKKLPVLKFDLLTAPDGTVSQHWELDFQLAAAHPSETWVVSYPLGGPVSHRPLEVPAKVRARIDGKPADGLGLIEIFDLRKSLRFSERP
jgi:hypothetical protein